MLKSIKVLTIILILFNLNLLANTLSIRSQLENTFLKSDETVTVFIDFSKLKESILFNQINEIVSKDGNGVYKSPLTFKPSITQCIFSYNSYATIQLLAITKASFKHLDYIYKELSGLLPKNFTIIQDRKKKLIEVNSPANKAFYVTLGKKDNLLFGSNYLKTLFKNDLERYDICSNLNQFTSGITVLFKVPQGIKTQIIRTQSVINRTPESLHTDMNFINSIEYGTVIIDIKSNVQVSFTVYFNRPRAIKEYNAVIEQYLPLIKFKLMSDTKGKLDGFINSIKVNKNNNRNFLTLSCTLSKYDLEILVRRYTSNKQFYLTSYSY